MALEWVGQHLEKALGFDTPTIVPLLYMLVRGTLIYFYGLLLTRFNKKLLAIRTPFNFILFVIFGSIFAGAIIDGNLFLPLSGTMLFLVLLNVLVNMFSYYSTRVERVVKGAPVVLVRDGVLQQKAMRSNFITDRELYNELYGQLHTDDMTRVKLATLESDGTISFIWKS